ncbi:MAG: glycosyltransferase [bacterium]|nr:glycosyltransferase [bacterium]
MSLETIIYYINVFFFIYMFVYAIIFFLTTFFASLSLDDFFVRKEHMSYTTLKNDDNYIPISVIVPAYNEELTIVDTVRSLLNLDYPKYEICVVNDGSTDKTKEILIETFNLKKITRPIRKQVPCKRLNSVYESVDGVRIMLINKENGMKADALNMGINACNYPLFVCMDADSMLQKDALRRIVVPYIEHDNTVAVGGNIKLSNDVVIVDGDLKKYRLPKKMIVKFQLVEYLRVFLTSRVAFNKFNANLIISGAFGLYNKSAVIKVGGYSVDSIGEDMELVVKLHAYFHKNKQDYHISYIPDAVCWTQAPDKFKILKNQRKRWHRGLIQSLRVNRFMFFNPTYGTVGMISYPFFVLFEYITPWLEVLGIITIIVSYLIGIINTQFFILYLLAYMGYSLVVSFVSVVLERNMFKNTMTRTMMFQMLGVCVLESFGYRQCCSLFRISAFFGKDNKWGTMIRKANTRTLEE